MRHDAVRSEEAYCRFCEMQLPDWTSAYAAMPRGEPLMTISHNGRIFLITGKPTLSCPCPWSKAHSACYP